MPPSALTSGSATVADLPAVATECLAPSANKLYACVLVVRNPPSRMHRIGIPGEVASYEPLQFAHMILLYIFQVRLRLAPGKSGMST